jgi:hypothetical protein
MSISEAISQFAGVIDATRAKLTDVAGRVESLEQDRRLIEQAKPHTDDIVAAFQRALKNHAQAFEQKLSGYLSSTFVSADDAANVASSKAVDLLRLMDRKSSFDETLGRTVNGQKVAPEIDISALAYFLRGRIEEEIPALVKRLCPAAARGMKASDRRQKLAEIDAQLETLRAEREALQAELGAARMIVNR